jgi:hypothetical protein
MYEKSTPRRVHRTHGRTGGRTTDQAQSRGQSIESSRVRRGVLAVSSVSRLHVLRLGRMPRRVMSIQRVRMYVLDDGFWRKVSYRLLRAHERAHRRRRYRVRDALRDDVDVRRVTSERRIRRDQRSEVETDALDHNHAEGAEQEVKLNEERRGERARDTEQPRHRMYESHAHQCSAQQARMRLVRCHLAARCSLLAGRVD